MRWPNAVEAVTGWTVLTLIVVLVVDSVALVQERPTETVSYLLWSWGKQWPILYILIGIAIGHMFLPLILPAIPPPPPPP